MDPCIADLVHYWHGETPNRQLAEVQSRLGRFRTRVAVVQLLEWIRYRSGSTFDRPLLIRRCDVWKDDLRVLLDMVDGLGELFSLTANRLDYRDDAPEELREGVETFVAAHYRPSSDIYP